MPPKRRGQAAAAAPTEKKARPSKLAKENDISAEEEAEIKEAFHLFSVENEDFDEKESVIPTQDVRRALIALGLPSKDKAEISSIISAIDPSNTGYVPYAPFLSVCAMKLHARTSDSISAEVETAFRLFTRGKDGPISVAHLRRIAKDLREDVSDEFLRDMIQEANGGESVHRGVDLGQFEGIMKRAGVF